MGNFIDEELLVADDNSLGAVAFYTQYAAQIRELLNQAPGQESEIPRNILALLLQDLAEGETASIAVLGRSSYRNTFTLDMLGYFLEINSVGYKFKIVVNKITRNDDGTIASTLMGKTSFLFPMTSSNLDVANAVIAVATASGIGCSLDDILVTIGPVFYDSSLIINTCTRDLFKATSSFINPQAAGVLSTDSVYGLPGVWYIALGTAFEDMEISLSIEDNSGNTNQASPVAGIVIANETKYFPTGEMLEVCDPFMLPYTSPLKAGSVLTAGSIENDVGLSVLSVHTRNFVYQFQGA